MKNFLKKAAAKLSLLDSSQIEKLFAESLEEIDLKDEILDSFDEGIILIDQKNKVFYINKAVDKIISCEKRRTNKGRNIFEVIKDNDITSFITNTLLGIDSFDSTSVSSYSSSLGSENAVKDFTYNVGENLKIVEISVEKNFCEFQNRPLHCVRIHDITKKRLEDNRLRRSESLAQMTTMAAGVAHEIKNPLASISIYLQLLKREFKKKEQLKEEDAQKYLSVIGEEIDRLNSIVVDFLFAVRPLTVNLRKENINDLILDLSNFVKAELDQNNIKLELKLESPLPKLMLDAQLFRNAALNILKNAIQAIQSVKDVRDGLISIETKVNYDMVEVTFSDNGCGIPQEKIGKIFEPYYTTKETGTGLGLTLLFKIMKEHEGDVNVISKVDEGTSFVLTFAIPKDERLRLPSLGETYETNNSNS